MSAPRGVEFDEEVVVLLDCQSEVFLGEDQNAFLLVVAAAQNEQRQE